jgi:hypothetical protein
MSYLSPLVALTGAVEADPPDAGVAAHYGSLFGEQRKLAAGAGFVDLSHRDIVRIAGPDRLSWLHSLTTQALEGLAPQTPVTTLILSPQGHVEHALYGYDDGSAFWAHVEPGEATRLVDWLDRMRFLMRVEVDDVSADYACVWSPASGARLVERAALPSYAEESGGPPAGVWAYEALRIAAGLPRLGRDTDHRTIPNEVGWVGSAVHLDKGCYRGQETVARVHTLGRPPRRLVLLHLDGSAEHLPAHGEPVADGERVVGLVDPEAGLHVRPALR